MATIDQLTKAQVLSRDMNIPVSLFGQNLRISLGQLIDLVTAQPEDIKVQYSKDGEEWHDSYKDGDKYMRISQDGGKTWSAAINIDAKDGQPGAEGATYYTWIKYSDIANPQFPSDIYDIPNEKTMYMGLSFNQPTPVESDNPALYQWIRIRGVDGNSLTDVGEYYAAGESATIPPPIGLFVQVPPNDMPEMTRQKPYLWNYEVTYFSNGKRQQTEPALIGTLGADGVGIQSVTNYYLASKRKSGVTTADTAEEKWTSREEEATALFGEEYPYLWNYEVIVYTNLRQQNTEPHLIGHWGKTGTSVMKSFVFKRSDKKPDIPVGGGYYDPVPEGWNDGIPSPENGWPVWMSSRVLTSDAQPPQDEKWSEPQLLADTSDIDFEFSSVANDPGDPESKPENWHNEATESDIWMAVRKNSNGVWGNWEVVMIKGEDGTSILVSFVFLRSEEQPEKPKGGSYKTPVPSGWSDGIPEENGKPLWMSKRIFTSNGGTPQEDEWSEPVKMIDTETTDYEWSSVETNPGNPTDNPENWHDPGVPGDIWMAQRQNINGVWGAWTIVRVKGEKGESGQASFLLDLDNEMAGIPVNAKNQPQITMPVTSNATVYKGAQIDTGWTFSGAFNGCSGTVDANSGKISVNGISAEKASVTVTARKANHSDLTATMNLYKVRGAVVYSLETSVSSISKDGEDNLSTNSITVTKYATDGYSQRTPESSHIVKAVRYIKGVAQSEETVVASGVTSGTLSNITTDTTAIEFTLYSSAENAVLDKERVPVVADGKSISKTDLNSLKKEVKDDIEQQIQPSIRPDTAFLILRGNMTYTVKLTVDYQFGQIQSINASVPPDTPSWLTATIAKDTDTTATLTVKTTVFPETGSKGNITITATIAGKTARLELPFMTGVSLQR